MTATTSSCEVLVSPGAPDAGAGMTLTGRLAGPPADHLSGRPLWITDHTGAVVGETTFAEFDGEAGMAGPITVKAPAAPGTYTWFAHLEELGEAGSSHHQAAPFSFTVTAHATRLVVWNVPSAVEAGQTLSMKVGLKCSSGCDMTGGTFEVRDHTGDRVGAAALTGALWPGSEGLYYAELELRAPGAEGLHEWQVQVPPQEAAYPHRAAAASFRVRTVAAADCTVRVEAVDRTLEVPLPNMSVVMHPYRGTTNDKGVAEIRVAKGKYSIVVSGRGYYPIQRNLEITSDLTTRALLETEPPASKDW